MTSRPINGKNAHKIPLSQYLNSR